MAEEIARRAVEQERLNTWCVAAGIESASDLAFYFVSYDEALREAGRAVADGWELARRESEPGMAALVRNLFARETVRQSRPPQPSSAAATSPPTSLVARPKPSSFAGPKEGAGAPVWRPGRCRLSVHPGPLGHHADFDATAAGPQRRVHANWHSRLEKICAKTEATSCDTWTIWASSSQILMPWLRLFVNTMVLLVFSLPWAG